MSFITSFTTVNCDLFVVHELRNSLAKNGIVQIIAEAIIYSITSVHGPEEDPFGLISWI